MLAEKLWGSKHFRSHKNLHRLYLLNIYPSTNLRQKSKERRRSSRISHSQKSPISAKCLNNLKTWVHKVKLARTHFIFESFIKERGDWVAQLLEHPQTSDPKFEPHQVHKNNLREFFRVENVVPTCRVYAQPHA